MVYLRQRFDAAEAVDLIERHRISAFGGAPTPWIALAQVPGIELQIVALDDPRRPGQTGEMRVRRCIV